MFKYILVLLISTSSFADEWTRSDTYREATYLTLLAIDWSQTRNFLRDPHYYELNPILGKHPSQDKVDAAVILTGLGHYLIARILPTEYRKAFQYVAIGVELGAVTHNYSIGVEIKY